MTKKGIALIMAAMALWACKGPEERAAGELAQRVAPSLASRIEFRHVGDTTDSYCIEAHGSRVRICGSNANSLAAGLGRYLHDCCAVDISWLSEHPVELPARLPLPDSTISGRALVEQRFFLNYCTYGYSMPWWKWPEWERFIDWMALNGINMPLALTGQDAVWQELWRANGLSDTDIRSWFTGPAHLPWHRMINIDGVDGPLPQGWIDGQKELQKKILRRERELGMHPVLPAFNGHVPKEFALLHPEAEISQIKGWCGFPEENRPWFLSPRDSLFAALQKEFLDIQTREYGTDHIYGFDLFNEIAPPSWDAGTLAEIARGAYGSIAAADPEGEWLQMGWMFYNDRRHWTPELIRSYLSAIPQGKVTILDYYTENIPVWTLTEGFYGQPWIFCYLGNFGGNTRLAGPFRKESERISAALGGTPDQVGGDGSGDGRGGSVIAGRDRQSPPSGIGGTLEGLGLNRWIHEYVLSRAWDTGTSDEVWLEDFGRRLGSPEGLRQELADSIYLRGSFSEGPLVCGRPCMQGDSHWTVISHTPYDNATLVRIWRRLVSSHAPGEAWKRDAIAIGSQALGNHFRQLRDSLAAAFGRSDAAEVQRLSERMRGLLQDIAALTACEKAFSLGLWLDAAGSWGDTPEEREYYRDNAWHLITLWGDTPYLHDYASRLWSGMVSCYYAPRWELFLDEVTACLSEGRSWSQEEFDLRSLELERRLSAHAPQVADSSEADVEQLCKQLIDKYF